jgi:hypothetical protein
MCCKSGATAFVSLPRTFRGMTKETNPSMRASKRALNTKTAKSAQAAKSANTDSTSLLAATSPDYWLTYDEVCNVVHETRHTVNKWRKRPEVGFPAPHVKPNRQLLFKRADILAWLETLAVAA